MPNDRPLSAKTEAALNALRQLDDEGLFAWPIEYEWQTSTRDEVATELESWLGDREWAADGTQFDLIGRDGTGGLFLLWHHPGLDGEPPVAFLGSEGGASLVADEATSFVHQLISGLALVGYGEAIGTWDELEPEDVADSSVDWTALRARVGAMVPADDRDPTSIRQAAIDQHPDFSAWVTANTSW